MVDDPGVLAAAALRRVDHGRALAQGDPGQAAGGDVGGLARQDERAQVDMARLDVVLDQRRRGRQRDHRLRDVVAGIAPDVAREVFQVLAACLRADQHAVAAGFVRRLDHEPGEVCQHVVAFLAVDALVRGYVRQDRLFIEVVADHRRHECVDDLVVRHAGPGRIRQPDLAAAPGAEQSLHANHRIVVERLRVEVEVVDPAIDDVDAFQPGDRLLVHAVVVADHQVGTQAELRAHLLSEVRVLEVSGVVDARRQHHDFGATATARRQRGQAVEQLRWVVVHRQDRAVGEQFREHPLHHQPVLEHVRHAGGHAQVVFEHVHRAVAVAHQVGAADVRPDTVRRRRPDALWPEILRVGQQFGREHLVLDDPLVVVDVVDEQVQRLDPLAQPALDARPLVARDHPRDDVERPGAVDRAAFLGVDGEGDAEVADRQVRGGPPVAHFLLGQRTKVVAEAARHGPYLAGCGEQRVVHAAGGVGLPVDGHVERLPVFPKQKTCL